MMNKKLSLLLLLAVLSSSFIGFTPISVNAGGGVIGSDTNVLMLPIIIFAILAVLFVALGRRRK